jgi:3-deoxy-D-manno-octulosonate 8-phosphate phosphatase (KDO 8-P phosphatase)
MLRLLSFAHMTHARDIRVIVSDVDGVWTDGKIIYAGDRSEVKNFNVRDGLGAKLIQRIGIQIVLLTSRSSHALARRARELGITELHQGATNKLVECEQILERLDIPFSQALYAGDDLPDLAPMLRAGLSAAPADAAA